MPASTSMAPVARPANPAPMTATSTSSCRAGRSERSVYVILEQPGEAPAGSMYWADPSGRSRLFRSAR